jgi:predicted ATPase
MQGAIAEGLTVKELRDDERHFQDLVWRQKLANEAAGDPQATTFLDFGLPETVAYLTYYGWPIPPDIRETVARATYGGAFLLEPLPSFTPHHTRTEGPEFLRRISGLIVAAYNEVGIEPIPVPIMSPEERADFIIAHLPKQPVQ